jgi:hypothetical protein
VLLALSFSVVFTQAAPKNSGDTGELFEITYDFPSPHVLRSGDYHAVSMEGLDRFGKPGFPVLPYKAVRILLPFDTEVSKVEVTCAEKITLYGSYTIEPGQRPVPIGFRGPVEFTRPAEEVYQSSRPFPEKRHAGWSVGCKRGYKFIILNLYPVECIALDGVISYYPQVTVRVHTTPVRAMQPRDHVPPTSRLSDQKRGYLRFRGRPSAREIKLIEGLVDNPRFMNSYPVVGETAAGEPSAGDSSGSPLGEGASTVLVPDNYEYVIITNEALENAGGAYAFQDLIDHKIARGTSATLVTTEWIYSNYDGTRPDGGVDKQTRIRNFIIDAYNTWGTEYVLLGGDGDAASVGGESGDNIIPARGFSVSIPVHADTDIPSDMYYACLDGSFDYDGDGLYGEPTDGPGGGEVDLFAEVYVGRAPVDSDGEVSNFVRKTIAYENSDPQDPNLKKALILGEDLGWIPWGCDYKEEVRDGSCNHGYCTIGFPGDWDITNLCDRDNPWTESDLISELDSGPHLVNHLGHASVSYNMKIYNSEVDGLTNDKHFFAYSQGCYSGSFDNRTETSGTYANYDCIAEHFVTEANGAFAVVMNSRYGWGNMYSTDGPSQHFDREFFDAYFGEHIRNLGIINQDSKEDCAGYVGEDLYGRWCCYQANLFGDPQTPVGGAGVGPAGMIALDREAYCPGGDVNIVVKDSHLNTDPTTIEQYTDIITIATTHLDEEDNITLTETGCDSGIFSGTVQTTDDPVNSSDGVLQITCSETDIITATYYDADDGNGNPATSTDTAYTDCLPPEISNLRVTYSDLTTAIITWETDEPAYSCVYYGTTPSLGSSTCNPGQVTSHSITLQGLIPDTTYYFSVASIDEAGNEAAADNHGEPYTCKGVTEVVFEDDMESGSNGWAATGFWHQVDDASPCPGSYSPTHSWWYGQDATCNYDNGRANGGSLISPRIELTGDNPVLKFMSWEETDGYYDLLDKRQLFVSTDNGASWIQFLQSMNNDADWYHVGPVDLSPYAGNAIYLKYHFDTVNNSSNNYRGWYIDDVALTYITDCGDGRLQLDRKKYDCDAVVDISLADCNLDIDSGVIDTITIEITSSSESSAEMVSLTETAPSSGRFEGSIQLEVGTPTSDGKLQVSEGDEITAIYDDAFPAESKTVAAIVDCSPPQITNVQATNVVYKSATVNWDTNESADSRIYYGTTLPTDSSEWASFLVTNHAVDLTDLLPDSTYYFAVASMDEAANQAIDNNNGQYYTFTTQPCVVDLLVGSPSEEFGLHQNRQTQILVFVQVCEEPAGNATVTVDFDNGEASLTLHDDGVAPDQAANDGWYGSYWTPQVTGRVTLSFTASVEEYDPVSEQVSGAVAYLAADFAAEHTYGPPPFTAQFSDLSRGDPEIENWLWEFGDGEFGTVQNPSHTYLHEGYYHVSLTVSYQGVQITETKYSYIHVLMDPPPEIDTITPDQGWNGSLTPVTISGYYFMDTPYVSIYGGDPEIRSSCGLSDPRGVYVSGNYAYVADHDSGLRIIDITDHGNPSLVGTCDTPGLASGVCVSGSYAYVADDSTGLQVIDISNPANPSVVGSCDTGVAYGVYVSGDYAYVADYVSGLQIIDITDPANPWFVGEYSTPGNAFGVYVSGNYAYVADGARGLQVIDINNPANPYKVGSYNTAGSSRGVYVSGDYAYIADNNWGLQIVNISNPANPSITGACGTPGAAKGVYVSEAYAYVADGSAGLQVIDVIDPANPSLIGSWDSDNKSLGVYISGHYAYVADGYVLGGVSQGLQVIDLSNHGNPSITGSCETPGVANNGVANGVHVSGSYAYVADGNAGLQVVDISDPANPSVVGACDTPYDAYSVYVSGSNAYVADGDSGLVVIDIADPSSPSQVAVCSTPGNARGVYVAGNYAYVADHAEGLQVIDISSPASPIIVGSYDTPGNARDVYVAGNHAFVADGDRGLHVVEVTVPTEPFLAGECDTPGSARGVYVSGHYAYVAGAGLNYDPPSLQVINVTDPSNPFIEGACATLDWEPSRSVYVSGSYAYVASNNAGLQVIDVTNPANPIIAGVCNTPSRAYGVYVSEDYVYVADWSGLRVVKSFVPFMDVSWLSESAITAIIPAEFLPGTYNLHITNPNNAKGIMYNAFTVTLTGNAPPVVSDIPDQTIAEGNNFATINLDDYVSDPDNADAEMNWSYAGNSELIVSITDRVATIAVPHWNWNGAEAVTFTAKDPGFLSDSDDATFTVTAVNDAPLVSDIPNQTIEEGESFAAINLDDYVSDVDNTDAEMNWSYAGNTELSVSITDRVATITAPNENWNGSESITFTATDPSLLSDTDDATFTVTAVNDGPVVSDIPNQTITEGNNFATINLDDYVSDVDNTDAEMNWSYAGNTELSVSITDRIATITIPHESWNGSETITFMATDPGLLYDTDAATFSVTGPSNLPPVADAGDNQVVYDTATLDGSGSHDPDGTIASYSWDLQHRDNLDHRVVGGVNPTVSGLEHGFYFVTLTVTDSDGNTATDEMLLGANHGCQP